MVPIIDPGLQFGKRAIICSKQTCIIIVTVQNRTFGLIVDAVHDLGTIYDENIYQVAL